MRTRFPFIEIVLVVDIREKVREFKAERRLTKVTSPNDRCDTEVQDN